MKTLIAVILLLLVLKGSTQVLGIDFGTEFWKAALISPGKNLVIVENSRSQRKTLNAIAFHQGVRFFEDDVRAKRIKKPNLTYTYLNKLINSLDQGVPIDGYEMKDDTYIFQTADQEMTLEQVIAMILGNIKNHASHQAGTDIRDVVLTVPANWGFKAKMSLVNAAHLAQFSVLGLINENSAAAIHYAISRSDSDPLNIMFFNLGSHNLQISIMKMFGHFDEAKNKTIQGIEVLGHYVKPDIGGLNIDYRISEYLAGQFAKKHKIDPKQNKKSFTKLLVKSSEVKETLSANKDVNVYIEGLIDGIDLQLPINRKVIEDHQSFNNFEKYIEAALQKANLQKSEIHSVQMIGGASRIPKVTSLVKQYFSDIEVGAHINGDESMAFGSALRAANLSLTFRVKQLYFNDPMNLDTKLVASTTDKGVISQQQLFALNDHHGAKKIINIAENKENVKFTVSIGDEIVKQFITKNINDWQQKYKSQNVTGQPELVVQFMMSSVHIAEIKDIYLNVTLNVTEVNEKVQYVDEEVQVDVVVQENKTEESTKDGQATDGEKVENNEQKSEEKPEESTGTEQQVEKPKTEKKKITKTKTVKKLVESYTIKSKRHIVGFDQTFAKYKRFTKDQSDQKTKIITNFDKYEKELKEKAKLRNDFQSALYNLKDNFDDPGLGKFSTQAQLTQLKQTVITQLEWMDQNAWTASKTDLQDHFKILSGVYQPIYNRTMQYRNRQKAYNESISYFSTIYKKASQLVTLHPWVAEQATNLLKKVNSTVEQLNSKLQKVIDQPLNVNPLIYNHEMVSMAERLRDEYYILKLIPRPKINPQKTKKEEETTKEQSKQEQQEEEQKEEDQQEEKDNEEYESQDEQSDKDKEDL